MAVEAVFAGKLMLIAFEILGVLLQGIHVPKENDHQIKPLSEIWARDFTQKFEFSNYRYSKGSTARREKG